MKYDCNVVYFNWENFGNAGTEYKGQKTRGARGVMVIVVGNGHGDTSSNPGRDSLHFT